MADTLDTGSATSVRVLMSALAATTSGILITDPNQPDNPIVYVNPGFGTMTGYDPEEVLGKNCRFLQGPNTDPAHVARIRETIARGESSTTTLRNYRKDGTPFWNELSISPVYEGETLTHFIGVQTDVTDREEATQLQIALDLAESIYETVREGLLILDENLRVFRANRAFYRMFSLTREETEGRLIYELDDHRWDIAPLRDLLERLLPTQNPFDDFEVDNEFPSSGRRTMHLNARRLDREGLPEFILLAIEDISDRKRSETELIARAEALTERDRAKDEFLAMLSHELRNPLNALAGALFLAEPLAEGNEALAAPLSIATRQVETMTALINDLLEVSRITQGKVELKRHNLSISELLLNAVRSVEAKTVGGRRIRIRTQIAPDVRAEADPLRLDQVFQNLLGNAVKFSGQGDVDVRLFEEGDWVVVQVRDTGIGVDPAFLPHMFELFRQGERSLARSEGGLGIGLTIAQRLVTLHGGTIAVFSEGLGQGATFTVRLPKPSRSETQAVPVPVPTPLEVRTSRALVVDDNRDGADILVKLLARQGYDARAAYDGEDALVTLRETKPDIVFLDLGLPGRDGYEIAAEIRQDPLLRGVFLIALTGYGQEEDRARTREAGFDVHLLKPLSMATLRDVLTRFATREG